MATFKVHGYKKATHDYNNYCGFHVVYLNTETGEVFTKTYVNEDSDKLDVVDTPFYPLWSGYNATHGINGRNVRMANLKKYAERVHEIGC